MNNTAKILVITGPFGSGKTTVTHLITAALRSTGRQVNIIALDAVSRDVIDNDLALRHELADTFGDHILNDDSSLDRSALAELAFADDQSTAKLNALVHPLTVTAARQLIASTLDAGHLPIIEMPFPATYFADIIYQSDLNASVWTVTADRETRLERGLADGYSLADARQRMDRQPRISAYTAEADVIIENCDGLDDLRLEVSMCLEQSSI